MGYLSLGLPKSGEGSDLLVGKMMGELRIKLSSVQTFSLSQSSLNEETVLTSSKGLIVVLLRNREGRIGSGERITGWLSSLFSLSIKV
jgi:hypothetical protein